MDALSSSLNLLGMSSLLQEDAAGVRVIEMLETLKQKAKTIQVKV